MTVANLLLQQQRIRGLAAHPPTATTTSSTTGSRGCVCVCWHVSLLLVKPHRNCLKTIVNYPHEICIKTTFFIG